MRLFQNGGIARSYRPRLDRLTRNCRTFDTAIAAFLDDHYGTSHFLLPILNKDPSAYFVNGDDEYSQRLWARERGMTDAASLADILLAQIEDHQTEIFYNLDPMRYGDAFLRNLPGCVRRTIAWRAAPSQGGAFLKHDIIVNNFPTLLEGYVAQGVRSEYFAPAHDPAMDVYAARIDRPIDVLFVGSFSRHHRRRSLLLEAVAGLRGEMAVAMHLDRSRLTRLAETPLGLIGPLGAHRRSRDIRAVALGPVFGRELLDAMSHARIVINGAIDMAGPDRGNMRVWEAMGCGAALVSDEGVYPDGMNAPDHFLSYSSVEQAIDLLRELHSNDARRQAIAVAGHAMIADRYSKKRQWQNFLEIVA